jgi:5-methylcytosine-specific restriction endonuclease McrA
MDYSQYHPDWKDIIRPSILQRDNYTCQGCGIRHKSKVYRKSKGDYHVCDEFEFEWAKANNKNPFILSLHIAHLDHDKMNNEPSNLLALCPRCHAKYDKDHKKFMRKVYKAKNTRPKFDKPFTIGKSESEIKAYVSQRYPWVVAAAPSESELNNIIRLIKNKM